VTDDRPDLTTTLFTLPPDAKFLPVSELTARLRARIGAVEPGYSVITRPGFRVTARLLPGPLAALVGEFRTPTLLTDGVMRFARAHDQDAVATLELAFDALATLVDARILVPQDSPDAKSPTPSLAAGQSFEGFEIDALVRSLEDSEVFRARTPDGALAALKIARDERPDVAAALSNEVRMLERLAGDIAPRLLASGRSGSRAYLAMEWCDGVSIAVAAQQARAGRDRRRLGDIVGRLFDAYATLHRSGILHGDVHPGNCLVRDDGRIVIIDFGRAREIARGATVDTARAGIPQFHDPEMAQALLSGGLPPAATPASEQFALGVLAYLLLTGLHPIDAPGIHDELLRRIVVRPPLPFAARGVASWPEVEAVLRKAQSKSARGRYADVARLATAFRTASAVQPRSISPPRDAERLFTSEAERARALEPSGDPLHQAWFALRAAIAIEDAELLAAADILARRAGRGWAAGFVTATVARARSDGTTERNGARTFLAAVQRTGGGPGAFAQVVAAATLLDGWTSRSPEADALASWAGQRLASLFSNAGIGQQGIPLALWTYAALALGRTQALRPEVRTALEHLADTHAGDVWLWAAAHDTFAEDRFRRLAGEQARHGRPLQQAYGLLRLHQLTGEIRLLEEANQLTARVGGRQGSGLAVALLVAELRMPERAILPAFLMEHEFKAAQG
jgi:predicted Ser/Thr protein kinase